MGTECTEIRADSLFIKIHLISAKKKDFIKKNVHFLLLAMKEHLGVFHHIGWCSLDPGLRPHLCGGPAGDTGSSPAGSQPVGDPEEEGLRAQHRWGDVQAVGHAVMTPCGEETPHVNARISLYFDVRSAVVNFLRSFLYRGWPSSTAERRAAVRADGTSSPRSVRAGLVFHPPCSSA